MNGVNVRRSTEQLESEPSKSGSVGGQELYVISVEAFYFLLLSLSSLLTFHCRNNRKRKFRSQRPKWVNPNVYLPPGFQNLFELSYFTSAKELVPVGWGSVDEDKDYPKLSSRDPQALHSMQEDDQPQDDYAMPNGRTQSEASSDVEEYDAPQLVGPTRMNEESSDEDEPPALAPNISRVRILLLASCISHCSVAFVLF